MPKRRELKRRARASLKRHYLLFVVICLLSAFLGSEFQNSLDGIKSGVWSVNDWMYGDKEEEGPVKREVTEKQNLLDVIPEPEAKQTGDQLMEGNPALGLSRGVLAKLVSGVTTGSITVSMISAIQGLVGSQDLGILIWILGSMLLTFLVWFFLRNIFIVISRRMYLEGLLYPHVATRRFLFLLRVRRWAKAALTMFLKTLFQILWSLTIIGGFIKKYSYYLVPYIVAENPDISPLSAITLSRRMMKGHKWQCFVFELTYLGWAVLDFFTFGLVGTFYSNPYKVAAFTEYYAELRRIAKEEGIEGAEALKDIYLYERPTREILVGAYGEAMAESQEPEMVLVGFRGFMVRNFGISLYSAREAHAYEEQQVRKIKRHNAKESLEGLRYPSRLYPLPEKHRNKWVEVLNYMRPYSVTSLILLYFIFCIVGWTWEVSQHVVAAGNFVNRGVLHGPWLPIYGTGGILILVVLNRLRKSPLAEFLAAIVLCGTVEYFTALVLEVTHDGNKWWDYSGYFLNLNGRICAEGLLVFGIMGMVIVYVLAPLLDNFLRRIPGRIALPICVILLGIFGVDQVYSAKHPNMGRGITDTSGAIDREWVLEGEHYEKHENT